MASSVNAKGIAVPLELPAASRRTLLAFVLSLILHLVCLGIGEILWRAGVWHVWSETLHKVIVKQSGAREQERKVLPVIFVDVVPQEDAEPPAQTPYYGIANTRAGNPNPTEQDSQPRFEGSQDKVLKTADTAETNPAAAVQREAVQRPLEAQPQGSVEPAESVEQSIGQAGAIDKAPVPKGPPVRASGPEPLPQEGQLMLASARPAPLEEAEQPAASTREQRPLTVAEALSRLPREGSDANQIAGRQYRQEGGVRRFSIQPNFDVQASPLGDYDARLVAAVQECWYGMLRAQGYSLDRIGRVVIEFRLMSDGRVEDLHVVESDVGEVYTTLCQLAITRTAPYDPWPSALRRLIGRDYRLVRFTFYY